MRKEGNKEKMQGGREGEREPGIPGRGGECE